MFGVIEITFKKIKEPALFVMMLFFLLICYCVSEMDPLVTQTSESSLMGQIVDGSSGGQSLLSSTAVAFALSIIIAIFTGASEIPRDIESGMIMLILSKPLRKREYLFGKYLGTLMLATLFFVTAELVIFGAHLIKTGHMYGIQAMLRQFYMIAALMPLIAITITVSCFMNDISAMIVSVIYILFSVIICFIPILTALLPKGYAGYSESLFLFVYYFFPNYVFFFQAFKVIGLIPVCLLIYSLSISAIFLYMASVRLERMDLSPNA